MFGILQFFTLFSLSFSAKLIGIDEYKNRYYESKKVKDSFGRKKRFCIYQGIVEASKIPADWHCWMHHTTDVSIKYRRLFWHKAHTPDVTGTIYCFRPNKHTQFNIHGKNFIHSEKNYTAWDGTLSE